MESILIVDDNADLRAAISDLLMEAGFDTCAVEEGKAALKQVRKAGPALALVDIKLPGMDGVELLEEMKKIDKDLIVIMLTAYGDIKSAVRTMSMGAWDYITKPFDNEELIVTIRKALEGRHLIREVESLRKRLGEKTLMTEKLGESPAIRRAVEQLNIVSPTTMTVLLQGESGTGKELVAQMIHQHSGRREKPFVAVDCGAMPDTLMESELFGYEKGAFTGADSPKAGRFEQAHEGSLFLDEIGNLSDGAQAKLLRALQEKTIQRLGGKRIIRVNVRVIVATNLDLSTRVREGKFRKDLFHRLNEYYIELPPLRDREGDIVFLADQFRREANDEFNKKVKGFSAEAMKSMTGYPWPGNVRELRNVVRRAVLTAGSGNVDQCHLSPDMLTLKGQSGLQWREEEAVTGLDAGTSFEEVTRQVGRQLLDGAIRKAGGNKARAAKMLGLDRKALYRKMKSLGMRLNGEGTE
ncbi:MAG: sigma-54 dependent transcriptional regulator [Chlamydiota bacterium]